MDGQEVQIQELQIQGKRDIQVLSPEVANLIAAGEVVERPASVAKELLENAIDAGSTAITIEIRNGGTNYLRITDNGCGIPSHQLETAFLRHATSKLQRAEHLTEIATLGFRGEALAAIAAVSKVKVTSGVVGATFAHCIKLEGGVVMELEETGAPSGTTILVEDIFFNTPARKKFMKTERGEGAAIFSLVQVVALSHPEIAVKFIRDGKTELSTSGDGILQTAIFHVLGKEIALGLRPVKHTNFDRELRGFVSLPSCCRASRNFQHFFVNGRYIKSPLLCRALEEAYRNQKMVGKFPAAVLHLQLDYRDVDVNVHPAKTQIKFAQEEDIFRLFHRGVLASLEGNKDIQKVGLSSVTPKSNVLEEKIFPTTINQSGSSLKSAKKEITSSSTGKEKPLPWEVEDSVSMEKEEDSIFEGEWKSILDVGFSTKKPEDKVEIPRDPGEINKESTGDNLSSGTHGNMTNLGKSHEEEEQEQPCVTAKVKDYQSVLDHPICKDPTIRGLYPSLGERRGEALEKAKERLSLLEQDREGNVEISQKKDDSSYEQKTFQSDEPTGHILERVKNITVSTIFSPEEDVEEENPVENYRQVVFSKEDTPSPSSRQRIDSKYQVKEEVCVETLIAQEASVLEHYSFDPVSPRPWKVVGEFLRTYVMVEMEDELFFIDKHAAHERLNFNRLKEQGYRPMIQRLLEGVSVDLSPEELACVKQYESLWEEFAFDVEEGERNQVILKGIPHTMEVDEVEEGFVAVLQDLMDYPVVDPEGMCDHMLHSISCKAAIKAGYDTSQEELEAIAQLVMTDQVRHCPHGRPIVSALTRKELEKKFGRST